jgi:hypothetical protein
MADFSPFANGRLALRRWTNGGTVRPRPTGEGKRPVRWRNGFVATALTACVVAPASTRAAEWIAPIDIDPGTAAAAIRPPRSARPATRR